MKDIIKEENMEEKILYLPLKKKWYEMIESGEKPEEYRVVGRRGATWRDQ